MMQDHPHEDNSGSTHTAKQNQDSNANSDGVPKPSGVSKQLQLATQLGLKCRFGVVHFVGRSEFTGQHKLAFQTNDPLEAMRELEKCTETLNEDEGCFLLLDPTMMAD